MRKIILLPLCLLLPLVLLVSCAKKDSLTVNKLTITIDPSAEQSVAVGGTLALKALCKSEKSDDVDISPAWSVETALGTFSPASGKNTTFTAGANVGTGKIYAAYKDVRGEMTVHLSSTGPPPVDNTKLVLLADAGASPDIKDPGTGIMQYFDGGDGSPDSPPWTISVGDVSPGCPTDSVKATQISYSDGVLYWGGFFFEFNAAKNLTTYTNLTFYAKGAVGGERFEIGISDGSTPQPKVLVGDGTYGTLTTSWQKITIPKTAFTGLNVASVLRPFILIFTNATTPGNKTIELDLIQFEQ